MEELSNIEYSLSKNEFVVLAALKELDHIHFFNSNELAESKTMLTAAALTYVASIVTTLIQVLRLIFNFAHIK